MNNIKEFFRILSMPVKIAILASIILILVIIFLLFSAIHIYEEPVKEESMTQHVVTEEEYLSMKEEFQNQIHELEKKSEEQNKMQQEEEKLIRERIQQEFMEEYGDSFKGEDGKNGINGIDGQDGKDGRNGTDGADGEDGIDGKDGEDGADGEDGKDGEDGADGKDGKDGEDGADGKDGRDGKDGTDGQDGKDGIDGAQGINGQTTYIAYAEDELGNGFSVTPTEKSKYIGTCITDESEQPIEPSAYTNWQIYRNYILTSTTDENGTTLYIQ